jgi:tRNA-Thr(GGU) m(6)t(6)A37 methyltransferase TsaA
MTKEKMILKPIGIINSSFKLAKGTPIQPAFAKNAEGIVEVFEEYSVGLKDLEGFERIWLIYWFDRCKDYELIVTPYMDIEQRGLFATRAPARPNPIGISPVKLERIEYNKMYISEIDILDGTPLLDIKPYSPKFDSFEVTRNGWLKNVKVDKHTADERFHR